MDQNLLPIQGIQLASTSAGIYKGIRNDVTLLQVIDGTTVSAVFTRNVFAAAPVLIAKKHLASDIAPQYLLINAGNANAGLGKNGELYAEETCTSISELTGCNMKAVLPFSTGVIGEKFPVEKINKVLPYLIDNLESGGWLESARAIMTTDTVAKAMSSEVILGGKRVAITGIAKGSGMIRPDMATMLAFIGTDAAINSYILKKLLDEVVDKTFNRITVDGDTSTNDACVAMATGTAGNEVINDLTSADYQNLKAGILKVCEYLAKSIIRDGEGATKFIEINIKNGKSSQECLLVAYAIAHSPLVKTAFFASDPNWGRILAAVGRAGIGDLDINHVNIFINNLCIVEHGARSNSYTELQGVSAMSNTEINLTVELGRGDYLESIWTCDLSHEYVSINANYRS